MKIALTVLLLVISNVVMTFAWYGFLRKPGQETMPSTWLKLIFLSWGVAFFEYCFMVPGNHLGREAGLSLAQLKITQEVITLMVFVPFMIFSWASSGSGITCGRFSASSAPYFS